MKSALALACVFVLISAARAEPPACQDMAGKVAQKFKAERDMPGPGAPTNPKCRAINLVISDLSDLAMACNRDQKFLDETYMPLAKAIAAEAPHACGQ
jgi:hypothetical protein